MKRILVILVLVMGVAFAAAAAELGGMSLKAGDEVYVCNCGEGCQCNSMAMKQSTCACGKEMAKGTVVKVEEETALIKVGSREQSFKTDGKYACACGPACGCGSISQMPGKCACGKDMQEVKSN